MIPTPTPEGSGRLTRTVRYGQTVKIGDDVLVTIAPREKQFKSGAGVRLTITAPLKQAITVPKDEPEPVVVRRGGGR